MPLRQPDQVLKLYEEAKSKRSAHESDWRTAAAYCLPAHYSSWLQTGPSYSSDKGASRRVAFDSTGTRSLPKYASVLERLATPDGQGWHGLAASDASLRKSFRVREYFDELTSLLFKKRYDPKARFRISTSEMYASMGVYGNGPIFVGERRPSVVSPVRGFQYTALHMKDVFFLVDDNGEIHMVFRRFWLNVRQFMLKFPNVPLPEKMKPEGEKSYPSEDKYFEFVHFVCPRDETDYDPMAIDSRRHPFASTHICVESKEYVGEEKGFASMPYKIPRTATVSGDPYGYSPAVMALSALGSASQMKKTNLKQGNKAADPVLLAHDDNVMNGTVDQRPGAINFGGVNRDGRELIRVLPTGNFRVAEVLLQDERADIEDSFFVSLFQTLKDRPEMTATEVMEHIADRAALLAPTMGRLQSEFLGPNIEREIDLLAEIGELPPMPPELIEAQGEYEVLYTSPMAKMMYAQHVSGFMRSVENALGLVNATQDASHLDHYNFDVAHPEIADYMAVPARWMNDPETVQKKRTERQEQSKEAQLLQAAPALASAAKTAGELGAQ